MRTVKKQMRGEHRLYPVDPALPTRIADLSEKRCAYFTRIQDSSRSERSERREKNFIFSLEFRAPPMNPEEFEFFVNKLCTTFYCRDVSQNSSPQNSYGGDGDAP